ncbi:MAG: TetR/AcrR family transcriptional regulator [Planctomycetota bacterium]
MVTQARKERERLEREDQILAHALEMLQQSGYLGLNMDRIAARMEYSKGTIYQHFRNKEEIILALANRALEKRVDMFRRAATWSGRPRERMAAIGAAAESFVEKYPHHFTVEQIVRCASIWEKTSEERRRIMETCESQCLQIVSGIVRDGLSSGELQLPEDRSPEDLVFGLWSMSWGAYTILTTSETLSENGITDPVLALRHNMHEMLDGYGWEPLSEVLDYNSVMDQVKAGFEREQS